MFHQGQQIGTYTLVKKLGAGGFGEVWLAEKRTVSPPEKVAIKLPLNDQISSQAIKDEIFNWSLAGKHKNILPIIECEPFGDQIAIVSEFAADGSLKDLLIRQQILPIEDAVETTIGILNGLAHLHTRRVIHRDLKPENIMLRGKIPLLTDFGISRVMTTGNTTQNLVGTTYYMAPEALDKKRNQQTDIWSVGVILYELLTGKLPFYNEDQRNLMLAIIMKEPTPLPSSIPSALQKIITKSLAKNPTERYKTAAKMCQDLENFLIELASINEFSTIKFKFDDPAQTTRVYEPPENTTANTLTSLRGQLIPYRNGNKWGFCDEHKNIIVKPKYESVTVFHEGLGVVGIKAKFGFIDNTGNEIIPLIYDFICPFQEDLSAVGIDGRYGFIDKTGQEFIPLIYSFVSSFSEGLGSVGFGNKCGYIDKNGREIVPMKYDQVSPFSGGLGSVKLRSKFGFVDKKGREFIPLRYDFVSPFQENLSGVGINGRFGFINKRGEEIIPLKYDFVSPFDNGLAVVKLNGKFGLVDKISQEFTSLDYDFMSAFSNGLGGVGRDGKYGFIDKTGEQVIPLKYDLVSSFSGDLGSVLLNGKYGYIDRNGTEYFED
jgi:serine/threonine protein kinase